jgi:hypothetical protein
MEMVKGSPSTVSIQRVHSRCSVDLMGLISAALSSCEGHKRVVQFLVALKIEAG